MRLRRLILRQKKLEDNQLKKVVKTENAPEPVSAYSQTLKVTEFLFVSGQVTIDPEEGRIIADSIRKQTVRVMENVKTILHAVGCNLSAVVQSNMSSMVLFNEFNDEYAR